MKFLKFATLILLIGAMFALTACIEDTANGPAAQPNLAEVTPCCDDCEDIDCDGLEGDCCTPDEPVASCCTPPEPEPEPVESCCDDDEHHHALPILDGTMVEHIRNNPVVMLQLTPLTPGEELAILHTNMGDITIRFFPDEAPMAVENFKTHARNGFYDGIIFHRVVPGFMIQGGCPYGRGTGGQSIWGGTFGTETSFNLRHFRGALAMAHAGPGTIGSQFYIVQNYSINAMERMEFTEDLQYLDEPIGRFEDGRIVTLGEIFPEESLRHFLDYGGTPFLDWLWNSQAPHPVFAHVVDGMDIVDAIANTDTVPNNPDQPESPQNPRTRPAEDMIIESISFFYYGS